MLEFYQAYATYKDLMDLTENMLAHVCKHVLDSMIIPYQTHSVNLTPPFKRMTLAEALLEKHPQLTPAILENLKALKQAAEHLSVPLDPTWGLGKVQLELFEKTV